MKARSRLADMIAERTLKQGANKQLTAEIAAYLLQERQVGQLESILRDVQADWAAKGYVEVLAHSAHLLPVSIKADITKQVAALYPNAKQIVVTEVLDPAIIGGVRLNLANQQLDLSVEAKLNKFKQLTAAGKE